MSWDFIESISYSLIVPICLLNFTFRSLRAIVNWAESRDVFNIEATKIRNEFNTNMNLAPGAANLLILSSNLFSFLWQILQKLCGWCEKRRQDYTTQLTQIHMLRLTCLGGHCSWEIQLFHWRQCTQKEFPPECPGKCVIWKKNVDCSLTVCYINLQTSNQYWHV